MNIRTVIVMSLAIGLVGCANQGYQYPTATYSNPYPAQQTNQYPPQYQEAPRQVSGPCDTNVGGAVVGGVAGGLLGSLVGGGTGNKIAIGVGAAGGALIGNQVGKQMNGCQ